MDKKTVVWLPRNPIEASNHEIKSPSMVLGFFFPPTGLVAQVQVWIEWSVGNKQCFRFSYLLLQITYIVKVGDNEKYTRFCPSLCISVLLVFLPFEIFLPIFGSVDL